MNKLLDYTINFLERKKERKKEPYHKGSLDNYFSGKKKQRQEIKKRI